MVSSGFSWNNTAIVKYRFVQSIISFIWHRDHRRNPFRRSIMKIMTRKCFLSFRPDVKLKEPFRNIFLGWFIFNSRFSIFFPDETKKNIVIYRQSRAGEPEITERFFCEFDIDEARSWGFILYSPWFLRVYRALHRINWVTRRIGYRLRTHPRWSAEMLFNVIKFREIRSVDPATGKLCILI